MKKIIFKTNNGFTLLEMTATLILIALVAGLSGMYISRAVELYKIYQENTETAQKARFVINRLVNEFVHITTINNATNKSIFFKSRFNNQESKLIEFNNKTNSLEIDHVLFCDSIYDFKLRYLDSVTAFDKTSYDIWNDQLSSHTTAIQFDIAFIKKNNSPQNFVYFNNITVVPRSLKE